jgi:hypothetical protein
VRGARRWLLGLLAALGPLAAAPAADSGARDFAALVSGEVLHANTLEFLDFALSDVVAKPTLRDQVLSFNDCHASAYGGTLVGSLVVDFKTELERYRCVIDFDNVDMVALLSGFGASAENFGGKLSGHLELTIPATNAERLNGRGSLAVKDGNLVELSFLANLLVGDISNTRGQDTAEATFEIDDGLVKVGSASVTMPKGKLLISGTVGLDGDLHLRVIPRVGNFLGLGFIPGLGKVLENVFGSASSYVARALVRGHISKPVVVLNPFGE